MSRLFSNLVVLVAVGLMSALSGTASAVNIDLVTVGNPGNAPDTRYATPGYGAVGYTYQMGKFEVSAREYTAFLNAVAKTDPYGLYHTYMDPAVYVYGCNIKQSGNSGNYTYTVGNGSPDDVTNWGNRPVNCVTWGDAARFANWLTNDQKSGTLTGDPAQDGPLTEDGSYHLHGEMNNEEIMAVERIRGEDRLPGKKYYCLPTEDEWYKAAYYNKGEETPGGELYWDYPTRSNSIPSNIVSNPDPGNNANYRDFDSTGNGTFSIGGPYWRTPRGEFENSESPYGTFDQGGNIHEWNEADYYGSSRGLRGGSFDYGPDRQHASSLYYFDPTAWGGASGFRVVEVPEPASAGLLLVGCLLSAVRGRRRK